MRLVDEITERPAPQPLPAPTGPRLPTGQVPATPVTPSARVEPGPLSEVPTLPRLAPSTPKPTGPQTGQVATTTLSLEAFLAANASGAGIGKPASTPEKHSHRFLIVLGGVIAVIMLLGVIFRDTAPIQRFTGKGYDTNPLPVHAVARPAFAGAEYTFTTQSIATINGLQTNIWRTERDRVDFTSKTANVTIDRAEASVIGGTIGTPRSTSPPADIIVDATAMYEAGATTSDPWVRHPHEPGWSMLAVFSQNQVLMYQDVIDPALRAQEPTSVVSETRHEIPVTTYTYDFAFGDFYESAPRLFDMVQVMDGNAAADADVTVTVSFDEQWMVRYLDVDIGFGAVFTYKAERDIETAYPYRYTFDVVSVTDKAEKIPLPVNTVYPPVETSTTMAAP